MQAHALLRTGLTLVAGLGIGSIGCSPSQAAMPTPEMPTNMEVRTVPPAPGTTRIVLDANGQDAVVTEVLSETTGKAYASGHTAYGHEEHTRKLCLTPCMVDVTPGLHTLQFQSRTDDGRASTALVQVGDRSLLVRHEMGKDRTQHWAASLGWVALSLGATTTLTAGTIYGVLDDPEARAGASAATTIGVGLLLAAIPLLIVGRNQREEPATAVYPVAKTARGFQF